MATRFNEIVLSFEHFANTTQYPNILCNLITDEGANSSTQVNQFLAALKTQYFSYAALMLVAKGIYTPNINATTQTHLQNWLFNNTNSTYPYIVKYIPNTFCKKVATTFSTTLEAIQEKSNYDSQMKQIFSTLLNVLYGQINGRFCVVNTGSACIDLSNGMNFPNFEANVSKIIDYVTSRKFNYLQSSDTTADQVTLTMFLDNLLLDMYSYTGIDQLWTKSHFNLLAICFKPYFCYLYITTFLPTYQIDATNEAPRSGVSRNYAVLAIYKFIMYFLYGTYKLIVDFDPSLSDALLIRQAIDINVISLYNNELDRFNAELNSNDAAVKATISKFGNLDQTNREIVMARVNATNIATNETGVEAARKKGNIFKILWITITVLYVIAFAAVYALCYFVEKMEIALDIFIACSVGLFAILCVIALVKMV